MSQSDQSFHFKFIYSVMFICTIVEHWMGYGFDWLTQFCMKKVKKLMQSFIVRGGSCLKMGADRLEFWIIKWHFLWKFSYLLQNPFFYNMKITFEISFMVCRKTNNDRRTSWKWEILSTLGHTRRNDRGWWWTADRQVCTDIYLVNGRTVTEL